MTGTPAMTSIRSIATSKQSDRSKEQKLIQRMRRGEENAFVDFVDRYKDRLFAAMRMRVGCQHEAEEIVQETFVKALIHLPSFRHQSQLYSWIYRIALNTSSSRIRKLRNEVSLETSGAGETSSAPEWSEPQFPMERHEQIVLLHRALDGIENRHRKILVLREFDDLSYQQIARQLAIPLGTVRSRLARARDRLREELVELESGTRDANQRFIAENPEVTREPDSNAYAGSPIELC